jgi:hypothetical protein
MQYRALIRELMDETVGDVAPVAAATRPEQGAGDQAAVRGKLERMGFTAADLDRCTSVCSGLRTVSGALNWLLIHLPEERIPAEMGSAQASSRKHGGEKREKRVKKVQVDTSKMTDAQKAAVWLVGLGFDPPDCKAASEQAFKPRRHTDALKALYEWYGIEWNWRDPGSDAGGTQINAAIKVEMSELQTRHPPDTGRFRVLAGTRNDAWRVRHPPLSVYLSHGHPLFCCRVSRRSSNVAANEEETDKRRRVCIGRESSPDDCTYPGCRVVVVVAI